MANFNPLSWGNMDITKLSVAKVFLQQLGAFLNTSLSASTLKPTLGLNVVNLSQPIASTSQTIDCNNSDRIVVFQPFNASITLSLTNLSAGAIVSLLTQNTAGGNVVLKIAPSLSGGGAMVAQMTSGGTITNLTAAGFTYTTGRLLQLIGVVNTALGQLDFVVS